MTGVGIWSKMEKMYVDSMHECDCPKCAERYETIVNLANQIIDLINDREKQEKMWNKLKEYADVSTRNYMEVLERESE